MFKLSLINIFIFLSAFISLTSVKACASDREICGSTCDNPVYKNINGRPVCQKYCYTECCRCVNDSIICVKKNDGLWLRC